MGAAACPTPGPWPAGGHRSLPAGNLGSGLHLCSWGLEGSPLLNDRACLGYPWLNYSSKAEVSKGGHLKTMSQTEGLLEERWWKEMKRLGQSDLSSVCLLRPVCFQSSVASNVPHKSAGIWNRIGSSQVNLKFRAAPKTCLHCIRWVWTRTVLTVTKVFPYLLNLSKNCFF